MKCTRLEANILYAMSKLGKGIKDNVIEQCQLSYASHQGFRQFSCMEDTIPKSIDAVGAYLDHPMLSVD